MKNVFFVIMAILISSCINESDNKIKEITVSIDVHEYNKSGMTYNVFRYANGGVFVVNITKDSLEVVSLTNK